MGTMGEVRAVSTTQKWGQNKKKFLGKGLKNPSLKFYSERAYQICHWAFLPKRGWQIRQKKARPKNGYNGRGQSR